jgi:oxygen-independent coproporphyrinogen-3 oxidase
MGTPHHITILPPRQTGGTLPRQTAGGALSHAHPPARSLYIHTPFCFHKCHYCDFYSIVDTQDRQRAFTTRLIDELRALAPHAAGAPLRTIFVGGGTPSLLHPDLWRELLRALDDLFDLSLIRMAARGPVSSRDGSPASADVPAAEFTVECNPESATPELMAILREGGVGRVSVGAQSFDLRHLKTLERWHSPDNVGRAIDAAQAAGIPRQSVDLIYAIPGQTLEEWDRDLSIALSFRTTHLSCYSLTYEPNTAMTARMRAGEFAPADEDLDTDMFLHTARTLAAAGLPRYEVSNFAVPGHESLHNLAYWRQEQWLAAGPSASGHVYAADDPAMGGFRWKNVPRLGDYLDSEGFSPVVEIETPDPARALRERIMMGIRLAEGIDAREILRAAGVTNPGQDSELASAAGKLVDRALLTTAGGRWTLTEDGFLMADGVAGELMAAV